MYLKSIEMQGFKSFPDKLSVTFHSGITAIVGPNGSGKSNISDAIRWVLGEQSTRTLRGGRMEDVIFAGTQSRRAQGFAEVSLTLDNSTHFLHADYDEVMVTRRFYRSGESEFYINRKAVKLRDIHELFMDTGLGRDGYSMIGQGKIDEILSARSEERREIFDEAAGITKFRYRRDEAERRLRSAAENLARINDIAQEIERQLEPLRVRAEKERKYIELAGELRALEVSAWLSEIEKNKSDLLTVQTLCENAAQDTQQARTAADTLYKVSEEAAQSAAALERKIEEVRTAQAQVTAQKGDVQQEIALRRASLARNAEEMERFRLEESEYGRREAALGAQLQVCRQALFDAQASLGALQETLARHSEEFDAAQTEDAGISDRAARLEVRALENREHMQALLVEQSSVQASLREIEERLSSLSQDESARRCAAADERIRLTEMEKARNAQAAALQEKQNVASGYGIKLEGRQRQVRTLGEQASSLSLEIGGMENRVRMLEDMARDYEGFGRAVRTAMREAQRGALRGIHAPVSELLQVDPAYVVAVETALGAQAQSIVVDSEEDAREAIRLLVRRDGGRATFLPLSAVRGNELQVPEIENEPGFVGVLSRLCGFDERYAQIVRNILGRCVVFNDMDTAIAAARRHRHAFRIVTLDGQLINAGGSMTGGSQSRGTGALARAGELAQLRASLSEKKQTLAARRAAHEEAAREEAALRYRIETAQSEIADVREALAAAQAEYSRQAALCARMEEDMEGQDTQKDALRIRSGALKETLLRVQSSLGAAQDAAEMLAQEKAAIAHEKSTISQKKEEKRVQCAALRASMAEKEAAALAAQAEIGALERQREGIRTDRAHRSAALASYGEKNRVLEEEIAAHRTRREELEHSLGALGESLSVLQAQKLAMEAEKVRRERAMQEQNQRLLNLEREAVRLDAQKNTLEERARRLTDKLWENYELTRSDAQAIRMALPADAARRIDELKKFIRALGGIQTGSIEEYEQLRERYAFLTTQKTDVEKSIASLEELIRDLQKQMRELFGAQFAVINESFGQVFTEVFGGGSACVELTDPSDVLGSGIEIRVQPPGKTLKVLSLLSGGEKAFVAIALYFAIMRVRPAPFCVLDEIDAALDDVNVARFAKFLRGMTCNTQFIVITHRRGTMEEADMLYGVAMPTRGISKLLALNVSDMMEAGLQEDAARAHA